MNPSPGAVGPACRLRRRYAHAPAAALLTGLGAGEWSPLRSRPYAHFSEVGGLRPPGRQGQGERRLPPPTCDGQPPLIAAGLVGSMANPWARYCTALIPPDSST